MARTHDVLARRGLGGKGGPKFKMTPNKIAQARAMYDYGERHDIEQAHAGGPGPAKARRRMSGWRAARVALDPLALLLRERFDSRAELARASGLGYERLRTYTDGLWRAASPPPRQVLAGLELAVGVEQVQAAVLASLAHRLQQAVPALSWGQRVVLEALREFDDALLVAAVPQVYELLVRQAQASHEVPIGRAASDGG